MWLGIPSILRRHRPASALRAYVLAVLCMAGAVSASASGPQVWHDPVTGLAIGGYDPVAYFTKKTPHAGKRHVELRWGGAVWRFLNTGNRAAFGRDPDVYAPRFAGYDAVAVADGRTAPGHPAIWEVYKARVYLFHNAVNFRLWQENRDRIIERAEKKWPELVRRLPLSPAE